MAFRVLAPCVLAKDQGGYVTHRYEGAVIPWLSDAQAEQFLSEGLVEAVELVPVDAALDDLGSDDLHGDGAGDDPGDRDSAGDGKRPLRAAPKADWVAYAVSKGAAEAEAEALSKQELVELYGG